VGFASAHHPRLRADHARWRAQAATARSEGRWANPRVGYAFAPLPIETRLGPNHHTFSASQKIPWPARAGAQQSAAATEADALAHDYDARYLVTRLDVELAYHSLYALHAEREVLTRELAVLDALEAGLGGRVEVGARPASELARVGLMRARVADRLGSLAAARAALEARLGEAMGLAGPHRVVFEGAPDPGAPLPAPEALEDTLAGAPTPPHLRALGERVEAQRRRRALAELDRMPDFEVGAQWSLIDEGDAAAQDRGRDAVVLRVGVSVPIWEASTAARIDASDARVAQAQATYEAERRRWLSGLRATLSRAQDADRRVALLEGTLLAQARATHEMVRGDYEAGRAEFGALLAAVRDIHELELELVRARVRRAQERARWRALLGRPSHQEQP
jgi:outer membrane protein TolC